MTGEPSRMDLLEKVFDFFWNQMETLESDNPKYAYVSYSDLNEMERLCEAVEEQHEQR
jgi:hypothetical protein